MTDQTLPVGYGTIRAGPLAFVLCMIEQEWCVKADTYSKEAEFLARSLQHHLGVGQEEDMKLVSSYLGRHAGHKHNSNLVQVDKGGAELCFTVSQSGGGSPASVTLTSCY